MKRESRLTKGEILDILRCDSPAELEMIYDRAVAVREEQIGKKVFTYGFVYFTTWCRNDCAFCYYRKSNKIERYRKTPEETLEQSRRLAESGVNLIDLTMGEDITFHRERFASVMEIVRKIKGELGLPVMISPGVIDDELIDGFASAGTDWYALYQETHNKGVFEKLRLAQDYDDRLHAKVYAREKGMLIEEGLLLGVGESLEDVADSIIEMGRIGASQVRVMSFVPQKGSPMENVKTPERDLELKTIAAMRLTYPQALIPASLDVEGISGLRDRIGAGSSVVTSIIPPQSGLMGVANSTLEVDEGERTVAGVEEILLDMGLRTATAAEYKEAIEALE